MRLKKKAGGLSGPLAISAKLMSMHRLTKQDLQNRVDDLEKQVTDLQNELGEKAFQLHEAEEASNGSQDSNEPDVDVEKLRWLLDIEQEFIQDLAKALEGTANQFAWAISMAQSIYLYKGPDRSVKEGLYTQFLQQTDEFIKNYNLGGYGYDSIMAEIELECEEWDVGDEAFATDLFDLLVHDADTDDLLDALLGPENLGPVGPDDEGDREGDNEE
jgi:hypothetical protein